MIFLLSCVIFTKLCDKFDRMFVVMMPKQLALAYNAFGLESYHSYL